MGPYLITIGMALDLVILTVVDYLFARQVHNTPIRFTGLSVAAVIEAGSVMWYFMHINRLWRHEEGGH